MLDDAVLVRTLPTPFGPLLAAATADALVELAWAEGASSVANDVSAEDHPATALQAEVARQLAAWFDRRLDRFDLPLAPDGTPFQRKVWDEIRRIPFGRTNDYAGVAHAVGSAPRAIGGACGANRIVLVIPCHRVLARNGLGGYSGGEGLVTKRALLAFEQDSNRVS